jgi:predicted ribosome quality control (RQC) complex YloA/Tae2 family protein
MHDAEIDAIAAELQGLLGRRLEGAWQPARDRVVLGLEGDALLLMVPRGPLARFHLISSRPKNPRAPFSFQGALRARLGGALEQVVRDPRDRAVTLAFSRGSLLLRLTGRSGGLWLLEDGAPIAAFDGPATAIPSLPPRPAHGDDVLRFRPADPAAPWAWSRAAEAWFDQKQRAGTDADRLGRVLAAGRRHLGRLARLEANLDADLAKASGAGDLRRQADALAAALYRVPKGATTAVVDDLGDPDVHWTVQLDPAKSPGSNLNVLYERVRRLERAGERTLERLIEVQEDRARLTALCDEAEKGGEAELATLERAVPRERVARDRDEPTAPWTTWRGPEGAVVFVGRNEAGNRRLSFQHARGNDWWMHLRDRPGPHVVIRVSPGTTPDLAVLLAAAQITLLASRIEVGAAAEVQYTRVKNIKAIPGESGGRVIVHEEKVLRVVRDPAALGVWATD